MVRFSSYPSLSERSNFADIISMKRLKIIMRYMFLEYLDIKLSTKITKINFTEKELIHRYQGKIRIPLRQKNRG